MSYTIIYVAKQIFNIQELKKHKKFYSKIQNIKCLYNYALDYRATKSVKYSMLWKSAEYNVSAQSVDRRKSALRSRSGPETDVTWSFRRVFFVWTCPDMSRPIVDDVDVLTVDLLMNSCGPPYNVEHDIDFS